MDFLLEGLQAVTWQQCIMYLVGIGLIYMAIKKGCEPALLLPMGFGAILVNLPLSGAINQITEGVGETKSVLFNGCSKPESRLPRHCRCFFSSESAL